MSKKEWTKDPFAEQQMQRFGVEWKIEDVALADIDWRESAANHARIGAPIDEGFVEELICALKNNAQFPKPVLRRIAKGKHVIYGGNHRMAAAKKCGLEGISSYIFESNDDAILKNLQRALNPPTLAVSRADRLVFAREAVLESGMMISQAAALYTLTEESLRRYITAENARGELCHMGVEGAMRLPNSTMDALARIKNPNVLRPAARLVCLGKFTLEETSHFVRDIIKERTEASQMSAVSAMEKETGLDGSAPKTSFIRPRSSGRGPAPSIRMAISTLEKNANVRTINQWGITDKTEQAHLIGRITKLVARLNSICKRST